MTARIEILVGPVFDLSGLNEQEGRDVGADGYGPLRIATLVFVLAGLKVERRRRYAGAPRRWSTVPLRRLAP